MAFWKKYVFLQALFLTVVMFLIGMYVGIVFEQKNLQKVENFYSNSEVSLMDAWALNSLINSGDASCDALKKANFEFADNIYNEALTLEEYEASGRITENMKLVHKKYDLLRTFLWMNSMEIREKCPGNFSSVVYLYDFYTEDLTKKAEQRIWSRVLYDFKTLNSDNILLIPIGVSSDLTSLNLLKEKYNISEYPVVIINEKYVITNMTSSDELFKYLN
ncbi:MAG: hypothetical protein WC812_00610 [Candidatus Pacearchaeota archaeon]|jgi:hypothetical protein